MGLCRTWSGNCGPGWGWPLSPCSGRSSHRRSAMNIHLIATLERLYHLRWRIGAVLALILVATAALAHEWYDPWCCNDRDCAPISQEHVSITEDGYLVTLEKGDHPMLLYS